MHLRLIRVGRDLVQPHGFIHPPPVAIRLLPVVFLLQACNHLSGTPKSKGSENLIYLFFLFKFGTKPFGCKN